MGLEAVNCEDLNSPKDKRGEDMILRSCTVSCCESNIVASKRAKVGKQAPSYDPSQPYIYLLG